MTDNLQTSFTAVRDVKLAYIDVGTGPTVLLLHGFPFDKSMWAEQTDELTAAGFRIIAPDLRGFGETKPTSEISTMDDMAHDAAGLLEQLQIDQVIVCGLSMGGYVAFEFAHLFPARVHALILAGTRAPADNEQEKAAENSRCRRCCAPEWSRLALRHCRNCLRSGHAQRNRTWSSEFGK